MYEGQYRYAFIHRSFYLYFLMQAGGASKT
jgi:hypothetical protein